MIDIALAFYLVFILPGVELWRSAHPADGPKRPRALRYLSTIREIALLLLVLAAVCWWCGHTSSALGLAAPVSGAGLWSLVIAAAAGSWRSRCLSASAGAAVHRRLCVDREPVVVDADPHRDTTVGPAPLL